ncbi:winged helix-turn-helix domain-containing protein [Halococcus sp. IIIV-5B]|uniref:winged helix-turn-helix domain-containing protein n=1 Tax=Halococcus sp. IIIV-5B TaxID=2321230 RepID=UPI000E75951E|nr:winged helix-turn-helix domain-containing protein [Halococcus sp. IIIV-5B]RJT07962.1 ArsR family transcriptional regulator [Halococcus sp. IIIV-5B]
MVDRGQLWDGDVNETVIEEWKDETTPFERIREVLRSTTEPQYANRLAERARVSEPTARKHLEILVETGIAVAVTTGNGTQYKRSRQTVAMQRIRDLHTQLSREELTNGIRDLRERIHGYQEEYDATSPDDLALQFASIDDAEWDIVAEWRTLKQDLDVAQAALALYDFTPDNDNRDEGSRSDSDAYGAFTSKSESGSGVSV